MLDLIGFAEKFVQFDVTGWVDESRLDDLTVEAMNEPRMETAIRGDYAGRRELSTKLLGDGCGGC
jgi:hypothetical protein